MKTELPQEYEQEREAIREEYEGKGKKRSKKFLISLVSLYILGTSLFITSNIKSDKLKKNYPIHQAHIDNQSSLRWLNNQLKKYMPKELPEFLSQDIRNELKNINIQDSVKISSLEKAIEETEQENERIINTPAYKEYFEKSKKFDRIGSFSLLGVMGIALLSMPGYFSIMGFNSKRKNKELAALKKRYGIISEESVI